MSRHPVEKLWREHGLPEYFLGNGGTNTKLYALYDSIRASAQGAPTAIEIVEELIEQFYEDPRTLYPDAEVLGALHKKKDALVASTLTSTPDEPAQCAPSLIEVASVIHEARFGRDYPENLRNSFDTECSSGRAYCIRLARAVMDGFRLSHVDASAVTSTPGQAIENTDGGAS